MNETEMELMDEAELRRKGHYVLRSTESQNDDNLIRAIIGGAVAAVGGGAIWAFVVLLTHYEIGWVAWGVGALVGYVMAQITSRRGQSIALIGAVLATVGLFTGKGMSVSYGMRPEMVDEIMGDSTQMVLVLMEEISNTKSWPDDIQSQLDGMSEADTLSDALWEEMFTVGSARLADRTTTEREQMVEEFAERVYAAVGFGTALRAYFSAWDLLWFGLAIATVWRMLNTPKLEAD